MAKQTKKTTQKSTAKQMVEKRAKQNKAPEKIAKPIRREIGAAICLFLGIFTILSIFGVKSWFTTKLLAPVCKGLVGNAGFYILPVSFFFSTFILLFHGGRPVRLRVTACFVMAGCIGAITHLLVLIGVRVHLFPSRTQKLSLLSPTIVAGRLAAKIGNANTITGLPKGGPVFYACKRWRRLGVDG